MAILSSRAQALLNKSRVTARSIDSGERKAAAVRIVESYLADPLNRQCGFTDLVTVHDALSRSADRSERMLGRILYVALLEMTDFNRVSYDTLAAKYRQAV